MVIVMDNIFEWDNGTHSNNSRSRCRKFSNGLLGLNHVAFQENINSHCINKVNRFSTPGNGQCFCDAKSTAYSAITSYFANI